MDRKTEAKCNARVMVEPTANGYIVSYGYKGQPADLFKEIYSDFADVIRRVYELGGPLNTGFDDFLGKNFSVVVGGD